MDTHYPIKVTLQLFVCAQMAIGLPNKTERELFQKNYFELFQSTLLLCYEREVPDFLDPVYR